MSRNSLLEAGAKSEGKVTSPFAPASTKEFLDIQATIECGFTLKRVRDMTRTYSQILTSLSVCKTLLFLHKRPYSPIHHKYFLKHALVTTSLLLSTVSELCTFPSFHEKRPLSIQEFSRKIQFLPHFYQFSQWVSFFKIIFQTSAFVKINQSFKHT